MLIEFSLIFKMTQFGQP
jgi:hypothetical protein